jgi:hypothetical protein
MAQKEWFNMVSKPKIYDYYVLVYSPKHSRAMGSGYVPEQILVAEKKLGRKLTPDEDVRHINGNTQDNTPSNLEVISINSGYKTKSVDFDSQKMGKGKNRVFMPCKFQIPCWKTIRGPMAKQNNFYLPYICSYQEGGDIYKCSHFWNFVEKEMEQEKQSV